MEERNLKLIFKYKEDLIKFGQKRLYNEMVNIIKDIDDKYIINAHPIDDEIFLLLGFKDNNEVKEKLNKISVSKLIPYIKTLTENIFKLLEDERSFISRCLKNTWDNVYNNLEIEFNIASYTELRLSIMSISKKSGCGSGRSFNFDIIDSEHLKQLINEVNNLDIPQSVKEMYINIFNEESEGNLDLAIVKDYVIENIVEGINEFIYQNKNKYKQYKSLYKQGVKEALIKYIKYDNWLGKIADAIEVNYGLKKAGWYDVNIDHVDCKEGEYYTNENKIEIKFLGEVIKTISKSEYTVYEIN
jgi:hypothetical protein